MKDDLKGKLLRDLMALETFQAQTGLEDEIYNSLLGNLLRIDLTKSDVSLEYAKLRGSLDTLKLLKITRERLVQDFRSRNPHS